MQTCSEEPLRSQGEDEAKSALEALLDDSLRQAIDRGQIGLQELISRLQFVLKHCLSAERPLQKRQFLVHKYLCQWAVGEELMRLIGFESSDKHFNRISTDESHQVLILKYKGLAQQQAEQLLKEKERAMEGSRELCKASCGFYGDPETSGYCSVCFKKQKQIVMTDRTSNKKASWESKWIRARKKLRCLLELIKKKAPMKEDGEREGEERRCSRELWTGRCQNCSIPALEVQESPLYGEDRLLTN